MPADGGPGPHGYPHDSPMAAARAAVPECAQHQDVFLHELMTTPPRPQEPEPLHQRYAALAGAARNVCAACPLLDLCLYEAVVISDVPGYVAATNHAERQRIREQLDLPTPAPHQDNAIVHALMVNHRPDPEGPDGPQPGVEAVLDAFDEVCGEDAVVAPDAEAPRRAPRAGLACAEMPSLFQHELLVSPPPEYNSAESVWKRYTDLTAAARALCLSCPVMTACLHNAVVNHEVHGFVGATSAAERRRIRALLEVPAPMSERLDVYAGVRGERQPVAREDVVQARLHHPDATMEELARRLGCGTSTVKRHVKALRQVAAEGADRAPSRAVEQAALLEAFETAIHRRSRRRRAAA